MTDLQEVKKRLRERIEEARKDKAFGLSDVLRAQLRGIELAEKHFKTHLEGLFWQLVEGKVEEAEKLARHELIREVDLLMGNHRDCNDFWQQWQSLKKRHLEETPEQEFDRRLKEGDYPNKRHGVEV